MGYIFDAINKQNQDTDTPPQSGESPTVETPLVAPVEQASLPFPSPQATDEPIAADSGSLSFAPDTLDTEPAPPTAGIILPPKSAPWWQFWRRDKAGKVDDRLVSKTSPASSMAEEYRSIRTSILARHQQERNIVHTITSATPQEGKTITCVNLGLAFAELRNRTTVILECDLRLPTFEKLLRLDHPAGLIPYLRGECTLDEAISRIDQNGLHVITAGDRVSDEAVQLLSSPRMARLIQALRAKFDHVIIDTPPVLELADAGILGAQSDEVLLVARMRRTPRPLIEQAVRTLTSYNAEVHGMIATDNPRSRGRGYGYRYGYRYGYHYSYTDSKRSSRRRSRRAA
ncbi:MAG: CpsD/CapB family tyrosine-protein kinase [Planctomycetota bacterium]